MKVRLPTVEALEKLKKAEEAIRDVANSTNCCGTSVIDVLAKRFQAENRPEMVWCLQVGYAAGTRDIIASSGLKTVDNPHIAALYDQAMQIMNDTAAEIERLVARDRAALDDQLLGCAGRVIQ